MAEDGNGECLFYLKIFFLQEQGQNLGPKIYTHYIYIYIYTVINNPLDPGLLLLDIMRQPL